MLGMLADVMQMALMARDRMTLNTVVLTRFESDAAVDAVLTLCRNSKGSFGLSIAGGAEHNLLAFVEAIVNVVELHAKNGPLEVGDQILVCCCVDWRCG